MSPESRRIADAYWASDLGCDVASLRPMEPLVKLQAGVHAGYDGAFILVLDAAPIVTVPRRLVAVLSSRAADFRTDVVADPARLHPLLPGSDPARMIGPAHVHYADRLGFRPAETSGCRRLTPLDQAALRALRAACAPPDWDAKDFSLDRDCVHGAFCPVTNDLLAIANFRVWGGQIAHLGVLSRPDARSRGHASRAVSSVALEALASGYVLQYRVLASNAPSLRVAQKLGFEPYGWSMAARFSAAS